MIPKRSLVYLLACLCVMLLIVIAGIIPEYLSSARLDQQIKSLQFQIEEQKSLGPVYQMLKNKTHTKDVMILPLPQKNPLSRTQVDAVPLTFREIARKANVDIISASPDLNFLGKDLRLLPIHTVVRGDFFNFRKFFIGLGEVPALERIEEIQIQQHEDTMEFKMKVWLAVS